MGITSSAPTGQQSLVYRSECRRTADSGCFREQWDFQANGQLGDLLISAGLSMDAIQRELTDINAVWHSKVPLRKPPYNAAYLVLLIGVISVVATTQTSSLCHSTTSKRSKNSSTTSWACDELPAGVVAGFIIAVLGLVMLVLGWSVWRRRCSEGYAAVEAHLAQSANTRWAQTGIAWRISSFQERHGKNSRLTVYFVEAFLLPEALQRLGVNPAHVQGVPPTGMPTGMQPMMQGGLGGGFGMPMPAGSNQPQGGQMVMPAIPQSYDYPEKGQQQGEAVPQVYEGTFAYPPPMPGFAPPGGYAYPQPAAQEQGQQSYPPTVPTGAAGYAYGYGGYSSYPPPEAGGPVGPAGPHGHTPPPTGQAPWQQPPGQAQGHAYLVQGSAPPPSDRTL